MVVVVLNIFNFFSATLNVLNAILRDIELKFLTGRILSLSRSYFSN